MESPRGDEATVPVDTVVTRGRSVPAAGLRAVFDSGEQPWIAWLGPDERVAVAGATETLRASGPTRFESVRRAGDRLLAEVEAPTDLPRSARPRLFGGFSFHEGGGEDAWAGFGDAFFVLPSVQVVAAGEAAWLTTTATGANAARRAESRLDTWSQRLASSSESAPSGPPGVDGRTRTPGRDGWREQVRDALSRVGAGTLEKVVLAQSMTVSLQSDLSVPGTLERLGRTYPECYRFAVSPGAGGTFFGATPERLVSRRGRRVETEALAGSAGRGETPAEDEWLAADLLRSEKDRREHDIVVEALRDQLEPLAATVRTGERTVRRLATVQHQRTPITADLAGDEHVLSLVDALHPTPGVGGRPPGEALDTIRAAEAFDRGWYAGPVGWFDGSGDGTFAVAIRSALARDRVVTLFAGAGIVADSDPDREWEEVQLKYRPIQDELE